LTLGTPPADLDERADALLAPLDQAKDRGYIGEPVSQLEHALQCAAAAERAGAPEEAVLAALFHDLGHLVGGDAPSMEGLGVVDHEQIGAQCLRDWGCAPAVADLVASHVAAKRYLCFRDPAYHAKLSDASRGTLAFQGGPMDEAEARAFAAQPDLSLILALRSWDERAKDPAARPPGLDHYRDRLRAHLASSQSGAPSC